MSQQHQQPQPRKGNRFFNIIIILIVVLVVLLIIQNATAGPNRNISMNDFQRQIGLQTDSNGDRYFNMNNNVWSVVQRANSNTFYVLSRRELTNAAPNRPSSALQNFHSNPSRHATWILNHNPGWQVTEIVIAQGEHARFENSGLAIGDPVNVTEAILSTAPAGTDWLGIFLAILPLLFLAVIVFFIFRSMSSRGGLSNMGRHRASVVRDSQIRFSDVAGIEEEKAEVEEIVQFLRNPRKFLEIGARIPKGFLLIGSPGTGKTLLAKAIAGEAGVPFFSISGSDFSEMLVGVGPSRMRDLFEQAKANAPCIIFIDEIDSIARMRGVGISGAAEENEQTLNQLLVQMDGFTKSEGVIVLAATNRPDVLDQALLRPGRFDRQIVVQMPDVAGREKILKVHTKNKPIGSDVDLKRVAQIISGFTGADIENLMNESAIIAAKANRKKITMVDITEGINKVLLGPQKRSRIITDDDKKITAYHEAGHAIVARVLQPKQVVQEVSIIPRGMAAGYTLTNDKDDVTAHKSKTFLKSQIVMYMGGRAAEQVFMGDVCTGATQDIKYATSLAEKMVTVFGMSDKLGPLYYGRHDEAMMRAYDDKRVSDKMQQLIDDEVKAIVIEAEQKAQQIMKDYKKQVEIMVAVLLERETIYAEDIDLIMDGKSKEDVIAQIAERDRLAKEAEKKDRIAAELEQLEIEFVRIRAMAQTYLEGGIRSEEQIKKLEKNMDIARTIVESGETLNYLPTLDNIEEYAKLVGYKKAKTEEPSEPIKPIEEIIEEKPKRAPRPPKTETPESTENS
ncbi:MAG: ATP-dependent zinc metalloprotease FtsH [Firmicutes bacterium]|nr:ATP-dependent zinc metalloprotease FtsH [Bacillota bacterium]